MKFIKKSFSILITFCLIASSLLLTSCGKKEEKFKTYYFEYFDTVTEIIGYAENKDEFDSVCADIEELLSKYHKLFDIYYKYSGINNLATINSKAFEEEVVVSDELIDFLLYSKESFYKTEGKVNIAMGSVLKIWHNYRENGIEEPENATLPPMDMLIEASKHTDIENLIIDEENKTVRILDEKLKLDVGAIAKGYTAEMIYDYLKEKGIDNYLLNLGGNIKTLGKSNGEKWVAGIENPDKTSSESFTELVALEDMAIVTSGSYQRYFTVDGVNYHHIIDNETLMPSDFFWSVSVITDDSALGDVLSTALFTLDYEDGIKLIESVENAEAMWVLKDGAKIYSDGFKNYIK